jgi:hypothetical protein
MPYDKSIKKRYLAMRWVARQESCPFGFSHLNEAIHYFLNNGQPRPCAYCGRIPENGKVWGLDRIDWSRGFVHGNVVPVCSSHYESPQLSCHGSKSRFSLLHWMERNMSRAYGTPVPFGVVKQRIDSIHAFAQQLASKEAEKR